MNLTPKTAIRHTLRKWLRGALACVLALAMLPALAQMARPIPDSAKRGVIRHHQGMVVIIDNDPRQLAPGAQIRDRNNLIIVPTMLPEEGSLADYTVGAGEQILRVWLLTEEEAARPKKDPR